MVSAIGRPCQKKMVSAKCDPKSKVGIVTNPTIIARSVLALG